MHKIKILASIVLIGFLFSSCNFYKESKSTIKTIELNFGNSDSRATPTAAYADSNVKAVWVKAFTADGIQIPDLNTADDPAGEPGVAVLTKTLDTLSWRGTISLDSNAVSGSIYLHAMGVNSEGEIIHQGTSELITTFATDPITIPSSIGYSLGNRGPGGGWIYYDKGTFSDDGKMGKPWRYLEAAVNDFSLAWVNAVENPDENDIAKIDTDTHKIDDGKVKKADDTVELSEYDWYWGPAEVYSTNVAVKEGWLNTGLLDDLSSATPNLKQVRGRKAPAEGTTNTRRDLSKTLRGTTINSYADWFVPSKGDLLRMFLNIVSGTTLADRNFANSKYWSSSENVGTDAYAIDFYTNPGDEVSQDRSEVARVRPARAF